MKLKHAVNILGGQETAEKLFLFLQKKLKYQIVAINLHSNIDIMLRWILKITSAWEATFQNYSTTTNLNRNAI